MTAPGASELVIILLIGVLLIVPVGLVIWSAVDVAKRSDAAFARAGQQRMLWLVLPLALLPLGLGWIASLVYLLAIRPKVIAAEVP
jgi:hypothetical protein